MITVRKSLMFLLGMMILPIAQVAEGVDERGGAREPGSKQGPKPGMKGERKRKGPVREDFMASYDRNKDGKISFEEFGSTRKTAALEEEGRRRLFNHLDKNKDGTITPNELPKAMPRPVRDSDLNRNGRISFEEFRQNERLKGVSEERIKAMFARMDRDNDRSLTPQDFRRRGPRPPDRSESDKLDTDRDHALSFREWKKSPRHKITPEEELRRRFNTLDRNKDGKLDDKDRDRERENGEGPRPGPRHHPPRRESGKP